jgi:hypothetical protein
MWMRVLACMYSVLMFPVCLSWLYAHLAFLHPRWLGSTSASSSHLCAIRIAEGNSLGTRSYWEQNRIRLPTIGKYCARSSCEAINIVELIVSDVQENAR